MPPSIPFLKQSDKVGVIATAKNFLMKDIAGGLKFLEKCGFEVVKGENLSKKHHQFAGTDDQRRSDFQKMLDDPEIKAIFFARGGYGTSRIIDQIDFSGFFSTPKWLIGFSDLTVVHCHVQRHNIPSVHGPMPVTFLRDGGEKSLETLIEMLTGKLPEYSVKKNRNNRPGTASGRIIGGNLTLLNTIVGTDSDLDYSGKILFIEDISEYLYHLDRMMIHLKRAGKLKDLAGLIVGQFTDMKDSTVPFGKTYEEIIADSVREYNFPICFGFPSGHEAVNMPLMLGYEAELMVTEKGSRLTYSR
jgi:muramoyltetrapeptide carboxypeptidase